MPQLYSLVYLLLSHVFENLLPVIWNILKGWLDQKLLDKVIILGGGYKDVLLKFIDASNLPSIYGFFQ